MSRNTASGSGKRVPTWESIGKQTAGRIEGIGGFSTYWGKFEKSVP